MGFCKFMCLVSPVKKRLVNFFFSLISLVIREIGFERYTSWLRNKININVQYLFKNLTIQPCRFIGRVYFISTIHVGQNYKGIIPSISSIYGVFSKLTHSF